MLLVICQISRIFFQPNGLDADFYVAGLKSQAFDSRGCEGAFAFMSIRIKIMNHVNVPIAKCDMTVLDQCIRF